MCQDHYLSTRCLELPSGWIIPQARRATTGERKTEAHSNDTHQRNSRHAKNLPWHLIQPLHCRPINVSSGSLGDASFSIKSHKGREKGMGSIPKSTVTTALQDFASHWPCHLFTLTHGNVSKNMPFVPATSLAWITGIAFEKLHIHSKSTLLYTSNQLAYDICLYLKKKKKSHLDTSNSITNNF